MRTTGFSKVMIAIVFAMASVLTMNAEVPRRLQMLKWTMVG